MSPQIGVGHTAASDLGMPIPKGTLDLSKLKAYSVRELGAMLPLPWAFSQVGNIMGFPV